MATLYIPLSLTPGITGIHLRPVCGMDELSVEEVNTGNILALLQSLVSQAGDINGRPDIAKIVTSDRDRIVAALYISLYGYKVESTLTCNNCTQRFDLDFSLKELLSHYNPGIAKLPVDGVYELEKGIRFRLPNGEDEMQLAGHVGVDGEKLLIMRCLLEGDPETNKEKVQAKMTELAPVLNLEMGAHCPECDHDQQVKFDIQSFLLMKLKQEQPGLVHEIHSIASHYHWAQREILELPRKLRKQYVALIESQDR